MNKKFLSLAYKEALKAGNRTCTNPLVGAVVVKKGRVIAKGFHPFFGGPHAEEAALTKAGTRARGADLYVTLEPCSSKGKRPPCTDIIKEHGIGQVFFGSYDINPKNRKKAAARLLKAGIKTTYIDRKDMEETFNLPFKHFIKTNLPFITLKAGLTLDGKLSDKNGRSQWITSPESRKRVHELRSQVNAVLVGAGTFNADNPKLNVRIPMKSAYADPSKIILSASGKLKATHDLFVKPQKSPVIIITTPKGEKVFRKRIKKLPPHIIIEAFASSNKNLPMKRVCKKLAIRHNICSILVEGGSETFSRFLSSGLYNQIYLFYSPRFFGTGKRVRPFLEKATHETASSGISHRIKDIQRIGPDCLTIIERK